MLAARYRQTGSSDVIAVEEVDTPEPGPGQVRVRMAVSGVNPTDWKTRSGATGGDPDDFQIPNQDGAGTIDAVGDGVNAARVGERVWTFLGAFGSPWGSAAQWSVLDSRRAVALHDAGFDLGASLGVPAMTAQHCLTADGPIDGANVLVAGGAGAVGQMAIQLARRAGARVVATVSGPEKGELATAVGAHAVVNYRDADAADQVREHLPDGADRIVEVDLEANRALDLAVLAGGGAIVTYADPGGELTFPTVRELMTANAVLRFVLLYGVPAETLDGVAAAVVEALPDLRTLPLHRFDLADTAAAHDAVEGGAIGKVLIDIPT